MRTNEFLKVIPQWILAIAFCILVLLMIYSLITNREPIGFVSYHQKGVDALLLVGSGTVYNYLLQRVPSIFISSDSTQVITLEGATETGAQVLSDAFFHGRDIKRKVLPILAMASRRLSLNDFIWTAKDRFFEVQIGFDSMKVTFGAPTKEAFLRTFVARGLAKTPSSLGDKQMLKISALRRWVWSSSEFTTQDSGYSVFVTGPGSATRKIFEELFRECDNSSGGGWPEDYEPFDLDFQNTMECERPWIALGSELLNSDKLVELQKAQKGIQFIVGNDNGQVVGRGLYLYGRIPQNRVPIPSSHGHIVAEGYILDPRISSFLVRLFEALDKSIGDKRFTMLLQRQRAYLHLDSSHPSFGWIEEHPGGSSQIYTTVDDAY
jgi:hypothetical protein